MLHIVRDCVGSDTDTANALHRGRLKLSQRTRQKASFRSERFCPDVSPSRHEVSYPTNILLDAQRPSRRLSFPTR